MQLLNKRITTIGIMLLSCLGSVSWALQPNEHIEVAISLDDAPMPGTILFGGVARTATIIKKLQEVNSPSIGIFALGVHAGQPIGRKRLAMYGASGHVIANHSYSHYRLGKVGAETFIQDIQKAHDHFCGLENFQPFFRFPYLYEGDNAAQRNKVLQALSALGYREGYITVCNYDFYINSLVAKALQRGQKVDYDKLRVVYLNILWDCIVFYDQLADRVLKRKVKHVLLLHANDLAALYLGDLVEFIRSKGGKIIAIEEAYTDDIAAMPITTTLSKHGRIAAIAHEKGVADKDLSHPSQSYDYIQSALEKAKVFSAPSSQQ